MKNKNLTSHTNKINKKFTLKYLRSSEIDVENQVNKLLTVEICNTNMHNSTYLLL